MPDKKGGKTGHKPYKGPWPEEHKSNPKGGAKQEKVHEKTHPEGGSHSTSTKIPPPTAK